MKSYIDELKAKNDFRREGLRGYKRGYFSVLIFSVFIALFIFALLINWQASLKSLEIFCFILLMIYLISLMYYLMSYFPWKLYNFGEYCLGEIVHAQYSGIPFLPGFGWTIKAEFKVSEKLIYASQTVNSFRNQEFLDFELPTEGRKIVIFFDKNNPENNKIFIPRYFYLNCLSISRFKGIMNSL